jgi:phosphate starvation-inducible protein PhoH and related proteins
MVITGDVTQIDLPRGKQSGLREVQHILKNIPDIRFVYLGQEDVVRHTLVQKVIDAYEKREEDKQLQADATEGIQPR